MLIFISWPSLVTSWVVVQKIYSKMYFVSCTNTHRDVTDSVNHGMIKNTKTWISWERKIIFLRNKEILNLCLRWHISRSYSFVAEVNLKVLGPTMVKWQRFKSFAQLHENALFLAIIYQLHKNQTSFLVNYIVFS